MQYCALNWGRQCNTCFSALLLSLWKPPKSTLGPWQGLPWLLVGCKEGHGSYQLFRHTQWLLLTWGTLGSITEVQGMEQWQPPTCSLLCPCLNLQERIWERHQDESSATSITSLRWLMTVTSDLCPSNEPHEAGATVAKLRLTGTEQQGSAERSRELKCKWLLVIWKTSVFPTGRSVVFLSEMWFCKQRVFWISSACLTFTIQVCGSNAFRGQWCITII